MIVNHDIYRIFNEPTNRPSIKGYLEDFALAKKEAENFIVYRIGRVELPKRSN